jgi:hypothetical protein
VVHLLLVVLLWQPSLLLVMLLVLVLVLVLVERTLAGEVQMLTRHLCKRLKRRQLLRGREREVDLLSIVHWAICARLRHVVGERQFVKLQQRPLAVAQW